MIKIIHYRQKCIGCNSCVEHAPEFWRMAKDGKVELIGAKQKKEVFICEIGLEDLAKNEHAENDCPMNIIKIENKN